MQVAADHRDELGAEFCFRGGEGVAGDLTMDRRLDGGGGQPRSDTQIRTADAS